MARPLGVLTVLMTVVRWLRPSMSAVHRGIFWVQAARCQSRISFSDTTLRTRFIQALAAIMQLGIYVTGAGRLLKAPFSLIGQTLAELCLTMEGWVLSEAFCQLGAGSAEVSSKGSLAEAESRMILIHWLSVPHIHVHMSEDSLFFFCLFDCLRSRCK